MNPKKNKFLNNFCEIFKLKKLITEREPNLILTNHRSTGNWYIKSP